MRRRDDATRGFDMAILICVSTVLRAVRPTLSMAYSTKSSSTAGIIINSFLTLSNSITACSPIISVDENVIWVILINGMMRCLEMVSADTYFKKVSREFMRSCISNLRPKRICFPFPFEFGTTQLKSKIL